MLICICDVFADVGIDLPAWVQRTRGFTVSVHEYDEMRDRAYAEIARRLEAALATSPSSATSRRRWQDPDADRLPDDSAPTIITVDTSSDPPVVGGPKTSWLETILGMP